jgi:hypothetical protein
MDAQTFLEATLCSDPHYRMAVGRYVLDKIEQLQADHKAFIRSYFSGMGVSEACIEHFINDEAGIISIELTHAEVAARWIAEHLRDGMSFDTLIQKVR